MASVNVGGLNPSSWLTTATKIARNAIWADNPFTQLVTNVVIITAAMLSSSVGFAPGLVIALAALFLIGVALVRLAYRALVG